MIKIGHGYDIHRLVVGRDLIIGGIAIPFDRGLLGHSDADILIHAIIDAMLGAASLGDIGKLFPDSDNSYSGINSRALLRKVNNLITDEYGYVISNIDSTVIIENPKLRQYIDLMRQNIAEDLKIDIDMISIKAKTNEGLGEVGIGDAAVAHAVILLQK